MLAPAAVSYEDPLSKVPIPAKQLVGIVHLLRAHTRGHIYDKTHMYVCEPAAFAVGGQPSLQSAQDMLGWL